MSDVLKTPPRLLKKKPGPAPKGKCIDCSKPVSTRLKRCDECAGKETRQALDAQKHKTFYRALTGEALKFPDQRFSMRGEFFYECYSQDEVSPSVSCGEFLEVLLALLHSRPDYVRENEVHRYAALIDNFKQFESRLFDAPVRAVQALPLSQLRAALDQWVHIWAREHNSQSPLLPSFVLDAGRFIEAHAWGRKFGDWTGRNNFRLKAIIRGWVADHNDLDTDKSLKKHVSESLRRTLVRVEIPAGVRLRDVRSQKIVHEGGCAYFGIERCHLSESVYEGEELTFEEDSPPRHDIAAEFQFPAIYWSNECVQDLLADREVSFQRREARVPARLIAATWGHATRTWTAVPSWRLD
jgi:hypothetical protein